MHKHITTRFCPSPTGLIHLGNLRTALFNVLLAKNMDGKFLLRVEDTDQTRSEERYVKSLQEDLLWLGLIWQEGPDRDGGHGPYYQSQRQSIYDDYYERLIAMGTAYPCFCSEEELALTRKLQRASGRPPRYPGTCRELNADEIKEKIEKGIKPTLRFRVPNHEEIRFTDLVHGEQVFQSADIGDFIIRRADGTPPFMYCNAIDDAMMEVTHVLRGEDHLTNTPRQIMILEALGLPIAHYGHIALILSEDGTPLSKRLGSLSIAALRETGYLPIAIINYLARLGHYYQNDQFMSINELANDFKLEALSKSPARFNMQQLNYWQKIAIEQLDLEAFWQWLGDGIAAEIPEEFKEIFATTLRPNICFPSEAQQWAQIIFQNQGIDVSVFEGCQAMTPEYFAQALHALTIHHANLNAILDHLKIELNLKGQALYLPLRLALTGMPHGPELAKIGIMMDVTEIERRLKRAQQYVENI